jgi:hypothetical protein
VRFFVLGSSGLFLSKVKPGGKPLPTSHDLTQDAPPHTEKQWRSTLDSEWAAATCLDASQQMKTHSIQNALAIILGFAAAMANAASLTNSFEGFLHGTVLRDQLAAQGAIFSSPSAENAPTVYGFFPSPVSPPNYLIGENEGEIDLNPGGEFGNNRPALPITITFVDPVNPAVPGTTSFVSFQDVFVNLGSITRADAFGPDGELLLSQTRAGQGGTYTSLFTLSHDGIHQVTVSFGVSGSTGAFEDHAGIDDLTFAPVTPVPDPLLSVILDRSGNQLVLSWPRNAAGFTLQSSSSLGSDATWTDCTNAVIAGNQYLMITTVSAASQFYRLKK